MPGKTLDPGNWNIARADSLSSCSCVTYRTGGFKGPIRLLKGDICSIERKITFLQNVIVCFPMSFRVILSDPMDYLFDATVCDEIDRQSVDVNGSPDVVKCFTNHGRTSQSTGHLFAIEVNR